MWGRDPRCFWVVQNAWREELHTNPMINLYRKLKKTKDHLQKWNKTQFRHIRHQVEEAKLALEKIELKDQIHEEALGEARANLSEALTREEIFWKQKSRVAWLQQGDRCTKFFMASTAIRRRRNYIQTVRTENGDWVTDPRSIADLFSSKFNSIFTSRTRSDLDGNSLINNPLIEDTTNQTLISIPLENEILKFIRSMGQDKAPGPDGMSVGFYIHHWNVIKKDFVDMVTHFFMYADLPQFINNTNMVLIPKKDCPTSVNEYRPIALCNVAYKCISKILALRLKPLLPNIISPAQSAFVHGRLIAENTAVSREIVHSMKQKKGNKGYMMIKLDMEKAYDKMDWGFILATLKGLGFHQNFVKWVEKCITIRQMGLLINGSVQGSIKPTCGLRQGDPLSPALFIIAADILWRLITTRMNEGSIHGFKVSRNGPPITHLMFADDVILFGKASVKEAKGFRKCLEDYCLWSGQAVNYQKSTVFFSKGVPSRLAGEISELLNMRRMRNDATYLGLPLFRSLNRSRDMHFLVDRALQRVKSWKTRLLSKVGKTCLIQSVGSSLATYVAASEPIPLNIAKKVDRCLRDFWWGDTDEKRKIHLLAWDSICQSKFRGGLGFRRIEVINQAFMAKWAWKALTDKTSIWSMVVNAKYIKDKNFLDLEKKGSESGLWKAILDARSVLGKGLCRKIENGHLTSIWFDPWVPSSNRTPTPLKDATHGVAWVHQFLNNNNTWNTQMVRELFGNEDANAILNIDLPEVNTDDSWQWVGEYNGLFSIKSAYRLIKSTVSRTNEEDVWKLMWNSPIHPRLKFLWWQVYRDILPTRGKLAPILKDICDICPLCMASTETTFHLFWSCSFVKAIWFSNGWGIRTENYAISDWKNWFGWFRQAANSPLNIPFNDLMVTTLCIIEVVWSERNRRVHGEKETDLIQILRLIRLKVKEHLLVANQKVVNILAWAPPPPQWACCNSDVAVLPNGSMLAAVIRDDSGSILSISTQEASYTDPLVAEAKAVCFAAKVAAEAATTQCNVDFRIEAVKMRFVQYCSMFEEWEITHISRMCNFAAHNVAKWAAMGRKSGAFVPHDMDSGVLDDLREWDLGPPNQLSNSWAFVFALF
ncbi:uncharacterized protein LOC115696664 [Cannabis sativa]|uniref:uncharacterized protein LOC115696664 n=1 Tax=Cannabis sativa TaxID=3483 RepID=UPI0011E06663|nr:uncharacterized protein LOC115696664 [Cannabis sativa]